MCKKNIFPELFDCILYFSIICIVLGIQLKKFWKLKNMWEKYCLMNWYVYIYTENKTTDFQDFLWDI